MRPAHELLVENAEDKAAFSAARNKCRRDGGGHFLAYQFLARGKRLGAYAVHAFCRLVDDVIAPPDEAGRAEAVPPPVDSFGQVPAGELKAAPDVERRIGQLRALLDAIYAGQLEIPRAEFRDERWHVLHAFARTVRRFDVPRQHFLDLAEGRRADLAVRRYPTWSRLRGHCDQVAGARALALCAVAGLTHSGAAEQAMQVAAAIRLTHVLRDVGADHARGRIYLPLEDLARFKYSERDLAGRVVNDNFRRLMGFEIDRARDLYRRGADGICWLADDRSRLAAAAVAVTGAGVLGAIERQGFDVFARPPRLSPAQQVRRLPAAWRLARRRPGEPLPDAFG